MRTRFVLATSYRRAKWDANRSGKWGVDALEMLRGEPGFVGESLTPPGAP